jgi:hypothetical protein
MIKIFFSVCETIIFLTIQHFVSYKTLGAWAREYEMDLECDHGKLWPRHRQVMSTCNNYSWHDLDNKIDFHDQRSISSEERERRGYRGRKSDREREREREREKERERQEGGEGERESEREREGRERKREREI